MPRELLFKCEYCKKPFSSEKWFLRHKCKEMHREKEFISINGQVAWDYYKTFMKLKHGTNTVGGNAFKHSKYFKIFYNFVSFVHKTNMPDVEIFLKLMIRSKIEPTYWTTEQAYGKYLEYLTRQASTEKLTEITIKTLFDVADAADVDIDAVFDVLTPNEVIQLLYQRRLSPWILLKSKKFADFFKNNTTPEERTIMGTIVNADYWSARFNKNPKDVESVIKYIHEMGL